MLKTVWRRLRSPAALAFAMVCGAPMLAEAQQGGLFPLAPIRRERVPCPMEDPIYGMYRHEYFGYFPTCWRQFPQGWGCPSPEAPDPALAFQKRPRDPRPEIIPEEAPPGETKPQPDQREMPDANPPLPLPSGRTPFQLDDDKKPGDAPPARPDAPARSPSPNTGRLESRPGAAAGTLRAATPAPRPAAPPSDMGATLGAPSNAPPVENPALLALPDPAPPASYSPPPPGGPPPGGAVSEPGPSAFGEPSPSRAPRRTSFLGNLFGGIGRIRR